MFIPPFDPTAHSILDAQLTCWSATIVIAINIDIYKLLMSDIVERLIMCSWILGLTHQLPPLTYTWMKRIS
jgi:hypothetical protein